jgi:hypothetical protein
MNLEFDRARLQATIEGLSDLLEGRWLLVGGAAVALWLEARRVTEDIDIVSISDAPGDRLALMEAAERLGLPIEAVNSAADFFVRRIADWEQRIEVLHRGRRATIYRPDATLLILLKLGRLSERDLLDCFAAIERCAADRVTLETALLLASLDGLPPTEDLDLADRRQRLRERLARDDASG